MLFLDFSVKEYEARLERIHKLMEERELDGLVLTEPTNLIYTTGYRTYLMNSRSRPFITVIAKGDDPVLILPNLEVGSGRKTSWVEDVRGWGTGLFADATNPFALVEQLLKEKNIDTGRLGTELASGQRIGMTLEQWDELQAAVPDAEWADAAALMWTARMIKSEKELEYIRVTCRAADAGFMSAFAAGREGVT